MKQTEMVLEYMKKHGSITALEAMQKLNCMRLAARIADLRKEGHVIVTETVRKQHGGNVASYAKYRLED